MDGDMRMLSPTITIDFFLPHIVFWMTMQCRFSLSDRSSADIVWFQIMQDASSIMFMTCLSSSAANAVMVDLLIVSHTNNSQQQ